MMAAPDRPFLFRHLLALAAAGTLQPALVAAQTAGQASYFEVPADSGAHDVAPDPRPGGPVYFTEQRKGRLGILRPADGHLDEIDLGATSAPHGVIIGPDGAVWITDGGQNAIVRFDPATGALRSWGLPGDAPAANLNTAAFDASGRIWFTGQAGYYGRLDPDSGRMQVWQAPRGVGPYGIAATPQGDIYFASLAGSYIARIDTDGGQATLIEPPTPKQGARRLASDSAGRLWVSYWNTGQLGLFDPAKGTWREWKLPGAAHAYAICVDASDRVWLSDWASNAIVRFDPASGTFTPFASNRPGAQVRQLATRGAEVWGAESGRDRLIMLPAN
jgi:virginiamycin B lyase